MANMCEYVKITYNRQDSITDGWTEKSAYILAKCWPFCDSIIEKFNKYEIKLVKALYEIVADHYK